MAEISVESIGGDAYRVTITDGDSSTSHHVTAHAADMARVGGNRAAEDIITASFRFLLDREPKESILGRFDLMVIGRYFPEYPSKIAGYL